MNRNFQSNTAHDAFQSLSLQVFEAIGPSISLLMIEAMRPEHATTGRLIPTSDRTGRRSRTNGFKPITCNSSLGKRQLQMMGQMRYCHKLM